MTSRNPLTTAEIEELKALEAQATPGTWECGQHPAMKRGGIIKPITFGTKVKVLPECEGGHVVLREEDALFIVAARNALLRLLSMLTPPPDAEVREAVECLEVIAEQLGRQWQKPICGIIDILQGPRPLWPDDDPMIVAMAAERDALRARVDALETVVHNADTLHRAIAEALGRKDMPNDLLVLTASALFTRVEKLERVREAAKGYLPYMPTSSARDGGSARHSGQLVDSDALKDALAECEEVDRG